MESSLSEKCGPEIYLSEQSSHQILFLKKLS